MILPDRGPEPPGEGNAVTTASALTTRPSPGLRNRFSALLVSGNSARRGALAHRMRQHGARTVIEAASPTDARRTNRIEGSRDLCIIDGTAIDGPIVTLVRDLRALGWRRITVLTHRSDAYAVRAALTSGIRSFVVAAPAPNPAYAGSVIPIQRNRLRNAPNELSARELEVVQAVAEGRSNKEIGDELGLSALTVKSHLARIARKLGTGDRAEMVCLTMRSGLIR